jgi:hypothetical protein
MTTAADLAQLKLERFNTNSLEAIGLIEALTRGVPGGRRGRRR